MVIPSGFTFGVAAPSNNTIDDVRQQLIAPARAHSQGNVTAIAIAPDSPIAACDLRIAGDNGQSIHRIGPGSPYVGRIDVDRHVDVTVVRDLPMLSRSVLFTGNPDPDQINETVWWDCNASIDPNLGLNIQVPLRLIVYRGDPPPMQITRAPLYAHVGWKVQDRGGAVATQPGLIIIVDGRRKVRVTAGRRTASGNASIQINGIEGFKSTVNNQAQGGILDLASQDELLATTLIPDVFANLVFDYDGVPYYAFEINILAGVIGAQGFITVKAYDE